MLPGHRYIKVYENTNRLEKIVWRKESWGNRLRENRFGDNKLGDQTS